MKIAIIGMDYKAAPIEIREKVSFETVSKKIDSLEYLKSEGVNESVIISTCNRSEVYLASKDLKNAIKAALNLYENSLGNEVIKRYLYIKEEQEAAEHLLGVATGFDSMVLGEDQILGQVKDAIEFSMENGFSSKILNKLFREAVTYSKFIRTKFRFSENPLSTCYTGIQLIKNNSCGIKNKDVLIIGAGNMGKLALKHVLNEEPNRVFMTNRRHERLLNAIKGIEGVFPIEYANRHDILKETEVLITATASPHIIFKAEDMSDIKNELTILDLAMPRDVDQSIKDMKNITLFDIDDLKQVVDENLEYRRRVVSECTSDIKKEAEKFIHWKNTSRLDPLLNYINRKCEEVRNNTLSYLEQNTELTESQREEIGNFVMLGLKEHFRKPVLKLKKPVVLDEYQDLRNALERFSEGNGG
ncbi:glutamyl-tRNA reductase [Alkalibacter mobilis]|uniref:glutamyl-tRNA reductase n=1 Tax=Alkalibacter mobilis TaxID=2787712 RepID=UPI00189D04E0|nr:glutamyl-tRNA reductase [Alkalibacter mobilis]MBF7097163.1 glutamyl-tRNA reductase [Alkalibacter mobilis]